MSRTTTYKCDWCGNEQDSEQQFWEVSIFVEHYPVNTYMARRPIKMMETCRACLEKYQLLPYSSGTRPEQAPGELTTAEKLEAVILEMIEQNMPEPD